MIRNSVLVCVMMVMSVLSARAESIVIFINGDQEPNNTLNICDCLKLKEMLLGISKLQCGQIVNGKVVLKEVTSYTKSDYTFLNGDFDHDGKITIADVVYLIEIFLKRKPVQYITISNGKIMYVEEGGFVFNPEEGDFIEDEEIEF